MTGQAAEATWSSAQAAGSARLTALFELPAWAGWQQRAEAISAYLDQQPADAALPPSPEIMLRAADERHSMPSLASLGSATYGEAVAVGGGSLALAARPRRARHRRHPGGRGHGGFPSRVPYLHGLGVALPDRQSTQAQGQPARRRLGRGGVRPVTRRTRPRGLTCHRHRRARRPLAVLVDVLPLARSLGSRRARRSSAWLRSGRNAATRARQVPSAGDDRDTDGRRGMPAAALGAVAPGPASADRRRPCCGSAGSAAVLRLWTEGAGGFPARLTTGRSTWRLTARGLHAMSMSLPFACCTSSPRRSRRLLAGDCGSLTPKPGPASRPVARWRGKNC